MRGHCRALAPNDIHQARPTIPLIAGMEFIVNSFNDPSAGSPTETLLRLLLPLEGLVYSCFQISKALLHAFNFGPKNSLNLPIGSSDGRCVQRAGT
jgi:hypothetical protein